jgi:hypothetical protein
MEFRKRHKPDYHRLDKEEDVLPRSSHSLGKIWRSEVIELEERLVDGVKQLLVHYSGCWELMIKCMG